AVNDILRFQKDIKDIAHTYKYPTNLLSAIKGAISNKGFDATPLSNLLHRTIDENKVRSSPIDFGLVTFSLTDLKPLEIFKEDIPQGQLIDYLLASACFPSFQPIKIEDKTFIDGGIYNNLPLSLMLAKD